jgi:hypothetical protein
VAFGGANVTDVTRVTDVVSLAADRSRRHARHAVTSEDFCAIGPDVSMVNTSAQARVIARATRCRQNP